MVKIPTVGDYIRLGMQISQCWSAKAQRLFLMQLLVTANPALRNMPGDFAMLHVLHRFWIGLPADVAEQFLFFCSVFEHGGEFIAQHCAVTDWQRWLQRAQNIVQQSRKS